MIRNRNSSKDDAAIVRLTQSELLPFTRLTTPEAEVKLPDLQKRFALGKTYVAESGAQAVAGFVSVQVSGTHLFVDMLAVDSKFHGRGLGTLLMERAEKYGRSKKCRLSSLYVDRVNQKAISFYQNKGYETTRYLPKLGVQLMQKKL
ncbi:N-acetyltransferase [Paenibacillus sp. FJAT-26967]|uniref:GNAT family N-acetyltransferase n=1 Tax=Paenibacillus sp. FJAT-26967 TaxID=1729690 RepID=UPI0008391269|nr:GNAT family N-acetyltransferase [Paenibacillus sp. FJAT-26967]